VPVTEGKDHLLHSSVMGYGIFIQIEKYTPYILATPEVQRNLSELEQTYVQKCNPPVICVLIAPESCYVDLEISLAPISKYPHSTIYPPICIH
jgi:hypothetical protein